MRIKSFVIYLFLSLFSVGLEAAVYTGQVVDETGVGVPYATVYLADNPVVGTATNMDGQFTLTTDESAAKEVVISFIGYEKQQYPLSYFSQEGRLIRLVVQPIALQEAVVAAKSSKQKNKKKAMAQLLYKVYNRMQYDFPETTTRYHIVSDVRMTSERTPWGMEQMIASVVNMPGKAREGRDSVQFKGEYCKRFFQQTIRDRANEILAGEDLTGDLRKAAVEIDSGVVVHKALWTMGNVRYDFEQTMNDLRHWSVSNESEKETVLTHVEKKNYIGIFKYEYRRHYIVDSDSYRILRFSEELTMAVNIPFGYKLKSSEVELLNLLNMSEDKIEKFRLRKANATVTLNTIYQLVTVPDRSSKALYPLEKNLSTKATLIGTKDQQIPIDVKATQRATSVTPNASPMRKGETNKRVQRENVSIY